MVDKKIIYFDLETTGLDPVMNTIHQVSMITEVNGHEVDRLNLFISPITRFRKVKTFMEDGKWKKELAMGLKNYSPDALDIAGLTIEQLVERGAEGNKAFNILKKFLATHCDKFTKNDKYFLIGFNNRKFDDNFLRQFFHDMADDYYGSYFWPNTSDVSVLATEFLMDRRETMDDFKLSGVATALGIEVDINRLHDGLYDVELTREIRNIIKK